MDTRAPAWWAGLRSVLEHRSAALLRTAYLLTGDGEPAGELLEDAVVATVARQRPGRDSREAEDLLRHEMVRLYLGGRYDTELTDRVGGPDDPRWADDREAMRYALAELSRPERAAVVLGFFDETPEPAAAAVLGTSRRRLRILLTRGLRRMRRSAGSLAGPMTRAVRDEPPTVVLAGSAAVPGAASGAVTAVLEPATVELVLLGPREPVTTC